MTMTGPEGIADRAAKPIPIVDEASRPFFEGAAAGKLMLLRCAVCEAWIAPTPTVATQRRPACVRCFSGKVDWERASGRGVLYSFAIVHQPYHPAFAEEIPYNISTVQLAEGVRLTAAVIDCASDDLQVGMPLVATFEQLSDEVAIPKFRPSQPAHQEAHQD